MNPPRSGQPTPGRPCRLPNVSSPSPPRPTPRPLQARKVAATDRRNDKRPQARTWVAFPRVAARRRGEEARILVARHVVVSQSVIVCLTPAALGGAAFGGLCRSRHPRGVLHRR